MGTIKTHKDLDVWKKAMELVKEVYLLTSSFPKEEIYGLVSQMRRAYQFQVASPKVLLEALTRILLDFCIYR